MEEAQRDLLNVVLMGLESYLPLDAIVAQLNMNPLKVKQENLLNENEIKLLVENWRLNGISEALIKELLKQKYIKIRRSILNMPITGETNCNIMFDQVKEKIAENLIKESVLQEETIVRKIQEWKK